jgi:hypothetical protein
MPPVWAPFIMGVVAGIGVVLVALNLRGMWRPRPGRPRLGRRSSQVGAEAERWLAGRLDGDYKDPG